MTGARSIVLVAGGLMFVFIRLSPDGLGSKYKRAWAAGVILVGLSLLADIAPQVAAPAAILVLLALAAKERGTLGQVLGNVGATVKAQPLKSSSSSPPVAGSTPAKPGAVNPNVGR